MIGKVVQAAGPATKRNVLGMFLIASAMGLLSLLSLPRVTTTILRGEDEEHHHHHVLLGGGLSHTKRLGADNHPNQLYNVEQSDVADLWFRLRRQIILSASQKDPLQQKHVLLKAASLDKDTQAVTQDLERMMNFDQSFSYPVDESFSFPLEGSFSFSHSPEIFDDKSPELEYYIDGTYEGDDEGSEMDSVSTSSNTAPALRHNQTNTPLLENETQDLSVFEEVDIMDDIDMSMSFGDPCFSYSFSFSMPGLDNLPMPDMDLEEDADFLEDSSNETEVVVANALTSTTSPALLRAQPQHQLVPNKPDDPLEETSFSSSDIDLFDDFMSMSFGDPPSFSHSYSFSYGDLAETPILEEGGSTLPHVEDKNQRSGYDARANQQPEVLDEQNEFGTMEDVQSAADELDLFGEFDMSMSYGDPSSFSYSYHQDLVESPSIGGGGSSENIPDDENIPRSRQQPRVDESGDIETAATEEDIQSAADELLYFDGFGMSMSFADPPSFSYSYWFSPPDMPNHHHTEHSQDEKNLMPEEDNEGPESSANQNVNVDPVDSDNVDSVVNESNEHTKQNTAGMADEDGGSSSDASNTNQGASPSPQSAQEKQRDLSAGSIAVMLVGMIAALAAAALVWLRHRANVAHQPDSGSLLSESSISDV